MDDTTRRIVQGLLQAIRTEAEGYHFYSMAAGSIQDEKGRRIFETLAQEEREHMRFLEVQYRSFLDKGEADQTASLGRRADLSGESPIFSEGIKERISEAHFEVSAVSIGIQLELASQQYYRKESEEADDHEVKSFFAELADWESDHYHALLRQHEALKEDYWSKAGFAPF